MSFCRKPVVLVLFFTFLSMSIETLSAQQLFRKFREMLFPVKMWIVTHPFSAKKAWETTREARQTADSMITDTELDGYYSGGQVDAFRHALWMAMLARQIGGKRAYSLGVAYEKANRIQYEKRLLEDDVLPDAISSVMDLRNNKAGVAIGKNNKQATQDELILIVKKAVLNGDLWIIKRNSEGLFIDQQGVIIEKEQYLGKWESPKCLVPSNYLKE